MPSRANSSITLSSNVSSLLSRRLRLNQKQMVRQSGSRRRTRNGSITLVF